jgi:AraC-like DNA-binding protein
LRKASGDGFRMVTRKEIKNNAKGIMNIILNSPTVPVVLEIIDYPEDFETEHVLVERDRELIKGDIHGKVHEILFDGICIEMRNVYLPEALEMTVEHDFPFLKMHFELSGHSSYRPLNSESLAVDIPGGHHQLFFFPCVKGKLYYPPTPSRTTLEITISHTFIKRMFYKEWHILRQLGQAIDGNTPLVLGTCSKKISPQLNVVIEQILNCNIEGIMRRPYLAAKVTELFILQLHELTDTTIDPKLESLSSNDISALAEARKYIKKNMREGCTILQLSKVVGLNRFKLKMGFKLIYEETIFEYLTKVRMREAEHLLKNTNLLIGEIANRVGYNHSQHFAKAFRKQCGMLPKDFKGR